VGTTILSRDERGATGISTPEGTAEGAGFESTLQDRATLFESIDDEGGFGGSSDSSNLSLMALSLLLTLVRPSMRLAGPH